jgi:psp operon transcriptional activator
MAKTPIIGQSPLFLATLEHVSRAAILHRPVVIAGERGTGKELIADRLHYLSSRWDQPFLKINCAALPETLLESELFGHEAGSFTGAGKRHIGRFERTGSGTLFLDEIVTMSPRLQEKLLRVIEYGEFERVGGSQTLQSRARIICAANQDLPTLARLGKFRADLLDRLAFDVITLPPLRHRPEDIPLLAAHFALNMIKEMRRSFFPGFTEQAGQALQDYDWPGNVRELKSVVERAVYHSGEDDLIDTVAFDPFASPFRLQQEVPVKAVTGRTCQSEALLEADPFPGSPEPVPADFKAHIQAIEQQLLEQALQENRYNQQQTAAALSLTYHQLRGYLRKYGIKTGKRAVSPP